MRRKVHPGIVIAVAIDQSAQGGERQIKAIDRMREEHAVAFRGFDGPQIVEFDDESVGFKQRRTADLALIVKSDRRTGKIQCATRRDFVVPGDFAVRDSQVADQRNQETVGHCVDERRAALHRLLFAHVDGAEGLGRHRLEPVGNALRRRHRRRQMAFEFARTAEFEMPRIIIVVIHF